jgi:hypothetical protein
MFAWRGTLLAQVLYLYLINSCMFRLAPSEFNLETKVAVHSRQFPQHIRNACSLNIRLFEWTLIHLFRYTYCQNYFGDNPFRKGVSVQGERFPILYYYAFFTQRKFRFPENSTYEGISKSFRTGRLERELQMVQLSATRYSCIAILWVSLVSFAAITPCVASQRVFIVVNIYFVIDSVRKLLDTPPYFDWIVRDMTTLKVIWRI